MGIFRKSATTAGAGRGHKGTCGKQVAEVQNRKSIAEQKVEEPSDAVQQWWTIGLTWISSISFYWLRELMDCFTKTAAIKFRKVIFLFLCHWGMASGIPYIVWGLTVYERHLKMTEGTSGWSPGCGMKERKSWVCSPWTRAGELDCSPQLSSGRRWQDKNEIRKCLSNRWEAAGVMWRGFQMSFRTKLSYLV